jgi:hypothetical protein
MSHDAKWFAIVAAALGIEVANRLSRAAAHAQGKSEAEYIVRALGLPAVAGLDDYLAVQDLLIGLLVPELLDYAVERLDDQTCRVHITRCFAHENVTRAGIAAQYECGIFARLAGWLQALGLHYAMSPYRDGCPKARGRECAYTIALRGQAAERPPLDTACP